MVSSLSAPAQPNGCTLNVTAIRYLVLIGGAVFSAGAGGSAVDAPDFRASASGVAGSGAGVVGRVPPGLDSAGALAPGA